MSKKQATRALKNARTESVVTTSHPGWIRFFIWGLAGAAGLFALLALFIFTENTAETSKLMLAGWNEYSAIIVRNKIHALMHASAIFAIASLILAFCFIIAPSSKRVKKIAAWLLVALVAADALWLARHYIKTMPIAAVAENDVVRIVREGQPDHRLALASQDGFYNFWLTHLFPYHGIRVINVAQMPRMSEDYKNFLNALGNNPLRLWQLMAVNHILAPAQFWMRINEDPELKQFFELAYAYNVKPLREGMGVEVIPATPENPGHHLVIRIKAPAPRYALLTGWRVAENEQALRLLTAPDYKLFQEALVAPEWADRLPQTSKPGTTGKIKRTEYRSGRIRLSVSTPETAMLRISEKYHPSWKAWINNVPVPVLRVDYLFQGVMVGPGIHDVVLRYSPGWWTMIVQLIAIFACVIAAWRILRSS